MRCWHYKLIPVLPINQLKGQWRECCLIAKGIAQNGTPNHLLVNKVLQYPSSHFTYYCNLVVEELKRRGYLVQKSAYDTLVTNIREGKDVFNQDHDVELYADWMTDRYLMQCFFNLQEKYDCGGLTIDEYRPLLALSIELLHVKDEEST